MPERLPLIEELAALTGMGNFVRDCGQELLEPRKNIWPSNPECFPEMADRISKVLPEEWNRFFWEFCLACHLLDQSNTPPVVYSWLKSASSHKDWVFPIALERLHEWHWGVLPLPLVDRKKRGVLRHALIGTSLTNTAVATQHFPPGITRSLDHEALRAVKTAIDLINRDMPGTSCVVWPFLYPDDTGFQIEQGSIGLPIYLSLKTLCQRGSLPNILATGCIENDGTLNCVEGLEQKYRLMPSAGCSAFIYPIVGNNDQLANSPHTHGDRFPVSALESAILVWNCYRMDVGENLRVCVDNLDKPHRLLELLPEIPAVMLPIPGDLAVRINKVINGFIDQDPTPADQSFAVFAEKMERSLASSGYDPNRAQRLLESVSPEIVEKLGKYNPRTGFRVAQLHMDVANRAGQVGCTQVWECLSNQCLESISVHDFEAERDTLLAEIRTFMVKHHNAYRFSVCDLDMLLQRIKNPLEQIETSFRNRRTQSRNRTDKVLGSCYGLIAQHYAYCGCLDKAFDYSDKALDAFGYLTPSPLLADCQQQLNYRVYMYIDSGDIISAGKYLCELLQVNCLSDLTPDVCSTPYHHAVVARYLAESGDRVENYCNWALQQLPSIRTQGHPWQLWSYNLGRIAASPEDKYSYFRTSLDICSQPGQPTIQVMALLPLSELWKHGLLNEQELASAVQKVMRVISSEDFDDDHFSGLLGKNWQGILDYVENNRKQLFPFNYS